MTLNGWIEFLQDYGLLLSGGSSGGPDQFGVSKAVWCFIWSLDFVSDELVRAEGAQHLSFVGFMEALCRVPMFIKLIEDNMLASYSLGAMSDANFQARRREEISHALMQRSVNAHLARLLNVAG